jgi:hypothetical protein
MAEPFSMSAIVTPAVSQLASSAEQRRAWRHRCSLAALTKLYDAATCRQHFAWIHDISSTGVAFEMRTALEGGREVLCRLRGNEPGERFEVAAQVIHCRPADGLFRVGCRFHEPFAGAQLDAVLRRLRSSDSAT